MIDNLFKLRITWKMGEYSMQCISCACETYSDDGLCSSCKNRNNIYNKLAELREHMQPAYESNKKILELYKLRDRLFKTKSDIVNVLVAAFIPTWVVMGILVYAMLGDSDIEAAVITFTFIPLILVVSFIMIGYIYKNNARSRTLEKIQRVEDLISAETENIVNIYMSSSRFVALEYCDYRILDRLMGYLLNSRAYTLKEAINLFELEVTLGKFTSNQAYYDNLAITYGANSAVADIITTMNLTSN